MQRIKLLLFLAFIVSGCSVSRHAEKVGNITTGRSFCVRETIAENLSNRDFSIKKINAEISSDGNSEEFLASVKFHFPDKWLISLRSAEGIEAARIFISGDSVLINDRLHKKLVVADNNLFLNKYNITTGFIPLILGDLVVNQRDSSKIISCENPILESSVLSGKLNVTFKFDCKIKKVKELGIKNINNSSLQVSIEKYGKSGKSYVPVHILVKNENLEVRLKFRPGDFEMEDNMNINFIPGKGYKREVLR